MTQAYAMTVYSSQGLTIDGDVFLYYTSGMDRANTYVACSRHKNYCHLFINDKEIGDNQSRISYLKEQMSTDSYPSLAIEYVENKSKKNREPEMAI
ncbi:hypothetical protein [uncultured Psychrosphaera sp.]|uniref:hypothetical protein n=1 Tax=uncultured Psychrosphaera sp. TaxID=1403522 RepID=UPI00260A4FD8|nr:hypothetical protein [uncultured Psychrosphaera sp.]